jgi:hypothetical protein
MEDRTKLGAAVVGGYILGRTKKGMAAARFAMWLSGSPQVMNAARTALAAPEVKQITDQVSGPLADAARKAALAAVLNRVGSMSDGLAKRTEKLTGAIEGTAETVTDTTEKAAKQPVNVGHRLTEALRGRGKKKEDKAEAEPKGEDTEPKGEPEGEEQEPEGEPEQAEGEDQGEDKGEEKGDQG